MNLKEKYFRYNNWAGRLKDLPLFLIRLVLAYGFLDPAIMKWKNINGVGEWFDSLGYPLPLFNAYLAAITETLGIILLLLGLGVRIISVPLGIVMIVAIVTVHWSNGFAAGDNGFEIPFYYVIFLFTLFIYGGGTWSLDNWLLNIK